MHRNDKLHSQVKHSSQSDPRNSNNYQIMNLLHPWLPQAERSKATTGLTASALMWQVFTNNVISGFLTCVLDFTLLSVAIPGTRAFLWLP